MHLVGFITKKSVTMNGHMNVKCVSFRFRNSGRNSIFKPHVLVSFYWATVLKAAAVLRNGQRRLLVARNTNFFRPWSSEF